MTDHPAEAPEVDLAALEDLERCWGSWQDYDSDDPECEPIENIIGAAFTLIRAQAERLARVENDANDALESVHARMAEQDADLAAAQDKAREAQGHFEAQIRFSNQCAYEEQQKQHALTRELAQARAEAVALLRYATHSFECPYHTVYWQPDHAGRCCCGLAALAPPEPAS